jgi:tetratricopeptide (TPR) repeat protein
MIEQIEERSESELEAIHYEERKIWRTIAGNGYTHPIIHLGQIYVNQGDTAYATELQESAARELGELDQSPSWQGTVAYNLACHHALVGEKKKAIEGLKKALDLNPELTEWSKEDPDLVSIREEPDCLALYER